MRLSKDKVNFYSYYAADKVKIQRRQESTYRI